ncbi:hypothetical protein GBZ26_13765 [Azospirillum formosense]|uniref:Nucleotidyltransferase n=1 Tax=Azospirillum formosense TaxID=861533 RepID=A0ABX2KUE3_9PROT|nr:hypothetical protein [Azospirillum formosense]MBY3756492.1 hypothetical protein [Azospirillum formosense]NUB20273.1 hypothetical protein [Azospirillum formosense]
MQMPRLDLSPDSFRQMLSEMDHTEVLQRTLLSNDEATHVKLQDQEYIQKSVARTYNVNANEVKVCIVGSAKLGFSISEKFENGHFLPRYRPFRTGSKFDPGSDIDVVVVCPRIFSRLWHELSQYSHDQTPPSPWRYKSLGDYLVNGWLRPDHFPKSANLRRCDDWWNCFRQLSVEPRFNRRKVRGGIFHSDTHVQQYYIKAIRECARAEEL